MTDEAETKHPAVTLADELGRVIAGHVANARLSGAAAEAGARGAVAEETARAIHDAMAPAIESMLQAVMDEMPADHPLRPLLESMHSPVHSIAAAILSAIGYAAAAYGTIMGMAQIYARPYLNTLNTLNTTLPLSPPDLANMVVQGYLTQTDAEKTAALTGLAAADLDLMVQVTGMPPSPQDLFALFRRGLIPLDTQVIHASYPGGAPPDLSVVGGLMQGHTKDAWIDLFKQLAHVWLSPTDFVAAAVREQVPYATAKDWAQKTGLDIETEVAPGIDQFDLAFDVAGRPPGPVELAHMTLRGIIPEHGTGPKVLSFDQGIAESDLKTKWTPALWDLAHPIPTAGELTTFVRHGFIKAEEAPAFYARLGMDAPLAQLFIDEALIEQVETDRVATKAEIIAGYEAGLWDEAQARAGLLVLGYHADVATELIALADFRREQQAWMRIVEQVGRLVITGKVDPTDASASLARMGVPAKQVKVYIDDWKQAKEIDVPVVTAAQIAGSVYYGLESVDEGMADLQALGYKAYNAWRVLSLRMHGPVKPKGGIPPRPQGAQV